MILTDIIHTLYAKDIVSVVSSIRELNVEVKKKIHQDTLLTTTTAALADDKEVILSKEKKHVKNLGKLEKYEEEVKFH